ncbi:MAG TPA: hypothetical protein VMV22_09080 [Acidimicrobiales bacterium]|nr:hypothetical protein [Acidimicrobiales bacterium]
MGGSNQSRRWSTPVTVAAVGALVLGSWLVVSAAAAPAAPSKAAAVTPTPTTHATTGPSPALEAPGTAAVGSTAPPTQSVGSAQAPVVPSSAPATTTAPAAPSTVPQPPAAPATVAPTPAPVAAPTPRAIRSPVAAPSPSGYGPVAAQLIAAINQKSGARDAIPATADNVGLLGRWIANEGGMWADNPLNTSLGSGSYPHQFTSGGADTGIPIFPSLAVGLAATATTLLSNPSYGRILRSLRSGSSPCLTFARAVIQSPWASSHYGHDPSRFCSGVAPARRGRGHHHPR